ncbi:MAG: SPOR domain-containing protein [Bacteroidetes bacterium]|nr:SPOR domain-containing protein [Bacteroidota bacterium]
MSLKIKEVRVIFFLLLLLFGETLFAQSSSVDTIYVPSHFKGWSLNLNAGSNIFYGDIRMNDFYPETKPRSERQWAYGIILSKKLSHIFSARAQFLIGQLSGVKKAGTGIDGYHRYFEAEIMEYSLHPVIDFTGIIYGTRRDQRFHLQGFVGAGLLQFRSRMYNMEADTILNLIGYSRIGQVKKSPQYDWVIPFGLIGNYFLTNRFSVIMEVTYRIGSSDDLDATRGMKKHDAYGYTSLGFTYHFSAPKTMKKKKKPVGETIPAENQVVINEEKPVRQEENKQAEVIAEDRNKERQTLEREEVPSKKSKEKPVTMNTNDDPEKQGHGFLPMIAKAPEPEAPLPAPAALEYRVQILATYMQRLGLEDIATKYKLKEKVKEYYTNGWYQYTVGSFADMEDAQRYKDKLMAELGLMDVFVVMFRNGNRFYSNARRKTMSFNVVNTEDVVFPKPDLDEEQEFENVEFRVQVGSITGKRLTPKQVQTHYNLQDDVKMDSINGTYYYSVGSYPKLRQAREYCKMLISRNFIYDAFVISYVGGHRRTLMELTTNIIPEERKDQAMKPGTEFRIQILALKDKRVPLSYFKEKYNIRETVTEERRGSTFVYLTGSFHSYTVATDAIKHLKESGITDAFIVAYNKEGKRITLREAFLEF